MDPPYLGRTYVRFRDGNRERRRDESSKAFAAFTVYRDLSPHRRSLIAAAAVACDLSDAGSLTVAERRRVESCRRTYATWSVQHAWVHRVAAWDEYLDLVRRADRIDAICHMADRHAEVGRLMVKTGVREVDGIDLGRLDADGRAAARVAVSFVVEGARIERDALGINAEPVRRSQATRYVQDQTVELLTSSPEVVDATAALLLAQARVRGTDTPG